MLECFECGMCGNACVGTELRLQTGRPARRVWVTCVALRAGAVSVAVAVAQNDGRLQMLRVRRRRGGQRGRPLGRWCVSVAAIVTAVAPCHRGRSAQPHAVPLRRSPSRHLSGSEPNSAIQCIQVAAISLAVNPVKFVHTLQLRTAAQPLAAFRLSCHARHARIHSRS